MPAFTADPASYEPAPVNYSGESAKGFWSDVGDWFSGLPGRVANVFTNQNSASAANNMEEIMQRLENLTDISGTANADYEYEKQTELLADQRAFNSAEAEKNRYYQERLSNSAYQRAVEDLEAAGLNKWLAVTGGNGASASTPTGSSATSSAGDASQPDPKMAKALLTFLASILRSGSSILASALR